LKDSFNSDFYVVAATVIPVLYLALTLQGSMFEEFVKQLKEHHPNPNLPLVPYLRAVGVVMIPIVSSLAVFAGIMGEFFALLGLYRRTASPNMTQVVFTSMILLLALIVAVPVVRFSVALIDNYKFLYSYPHQPKGEPDTSSPDQPKGEPEATSS